MDYRRSVIAQDQAYAASGALTFDLPVNPLSFLVVTFRMLNVTDEATLTEILARCGDIEITRYGESIFSMSAADLHKMNMVLFGKAPFVANQVATDNAARTISLIVPFARKLYNPNEGIGSSQRGELKIQVTAGSADTAADNATVQIESLEMLGASPQQFIKMTTLSLTPTSGIDNDIALPIGNRYVGIGLFSTTVPTGTAFTTTIDKVKLLLDNVERYFASANWESLRGSLLHRVGHMQTYDGSADDDDFNLYAYMDFSPNMEDDWLVETSGVTQATLRITAGDANALRAFPIELVANR